MTGTTTMRIGLRRGLTEFWNMLRTPTEGGWYIFGAIVTVVAVWFTKDLTLDGDLPFPLFLLPGIIAMQLVFTAGFGTATVLSTEREDGTLLRAKSLPNGMAGYVFGLSTRAFLETLLAMLIVIVPASFIVPTLWSRGPVAIVTMCGLLLLGILATLPIGFAIGSVFRNPRAVSGWGMLVFVGLTAISGVFYPVTLLPEWLQLAVQVFPLYWLGLGLRGALLPDGMVVVEIGESWRVAETLGVLGVWAIIGLALAPVLLRRMARRESGSAVAARREAALRRV